MLPDGISYSGFHFLIGYVISVRDTEKHFIPNACILLSMSAVMVHLSHAFKIGHGQGTHQFDLGADGDVFVVLNNF